jgi:transcriptional regulator GlxA family with amidase domain
MSYPAIHGPTNGNPNTDGARQKRDVHVIIVLLPRTTLLDLAGPLEVLRCANIMQDAVEFHVSYLSVRSSVSTSVGIFLQCPDPLPSSLPDNSVVVVVGNVAGPCSWCDPTNEIEDARDTEDIANWLRTSIRPTHTLIAICSGALLLAKAGLLDGKSCTTHHLDTTELARLAPKARVLTDRLYVHEGNLYTSAGVTAGIDLMLYYVSRLVGSACTAAIARYLVVYFRRDGSDSQSSPWLEGRNHIHPAVHRIQDTISADPTRTWTRPQLAKLAGASGRHLSRLFHEHVGMSIPEYRNRIRVALARELVLRSELDMENIADRVGFSSTRQFRRAWQQVYPQSPAEARVLSDTNLL